MPRRNKNAGGIIPKAATRNTAPMGTPAQRPAKLGSRLTTGATGTNYTGYTGPRSSHKSKRSVVKKS